MLGFLVVVAHAGGPWNIACNIWGRTRWGSRLMPTRKAMKKYDPDVTQKITSLQILCGEENVMGHIVAAAWSTGGTHLRVNLLTGRVEPSPLLVPKVKECLDSFVRHFPSLLEHSRSHVSVVASAQLSVTVDPTTLRPYGDSGLAESPYVCSTRIVDDRGGVHEYSVSGWWYPEPSSLEGGSWRVRRNSKKV